MQKSKNTPISAHAIQKASGWHIMPIKAVAEITNLSPITLRRYIADNKITVPTTENGVRSYYLNVSQLNRLAALQRDRTVRQAINDIATELQRLNHVTPDAFYTAAAAHWLDVQGELLDDALAGYEHSPQHYSTLCGHHALIEDQKRQYPKITSAWALYVDNKRFMQDEHCVELENGKMLFRYTVMVRPLAATPRVPDVTTARHIFFDVGYVCQCLGLDRVELVKDGTKKRRIDWHRARNGNFNDWQAGNWVLIRAYDDAIDVPNRRADWVMTGASVLALINDTFPNGYDSQTAQAVAGLSALVLAYDKQIKSDTALMEALHVMYRDASAVLEAQNRETDTPVVATPTMPAEPKPQRDTSGMLPHGTQFIAVKNPSRQMRAVYFKDVGGALYEWVSTAGKEGWQPSSIRTVGTLRARYKKVLDLKV